MRSYVHDDDGDGDGDSDGDDDDDDDDERMMMVIQHSLHQFSQRIDSQPCQMRIMKHICNNPS